MQKKIQIAKESIRPSLLSPVRLKIAGNITEVRYMARKPDIRIRKRDKDTYVDLSTGEIRNFSHGESRAANIAGVAKSLGKLRDILNTNITDTHNCLWVTLTYAENMQDTQRLYHDFRKFNMRFHTFIKKNKLPPYEYIVAMEPQGRGAWHCHVVLIFSRKAPFVSNSDLRKVWKHGFVKIKALKNISNVGVYLTAYMASMELGDALKNMTLDKLDARKIKQIAIKDSDGKDETKAYIKGARLCLYPVGFRIFRKSRGILPPSIKECTYADALHEIGDAQKTYEKAINVLDAHGNVTNTILYLHYNKNL